MTEEQVRILGPPAIDELSDELTAIHFINGTMNYVLNAQRNCECEHLHKLHAILSENAGLELEGHIDAVHA